MIKILALLLLNSCFQKENRKTPKLICENRIEDRKCPQGLGKVFLPRSFPARAIYVGFADNEFHKNFLETLIQKAMVSKSKPRLNVLIPHNEDDLAYAFFSKNFDDPKYEFINFIPTAADDTVWAQDYLEILFDTKSGKSSIVDLPYFGREAENIPFGLALQCKKQLIEQRGFSEEDPPGNGDYGGNIEPITTKVLALGNNLSNETYAIIKKITTQKIIDVNVEWLETGHVDELITTIPHNKNSGDCEQTILIASPQLGLDLINQSALNKNKDEQKYEVYYDEYEKWPDLNECLYIENKNKKECIEFAKANRTYQSLIDFSLDSLQSQIENEHGCRLKTVKFPQLFVPLKIQKVYGTIDDRAISLNPNSVNNIFFYPNLLLAKQVYPPFQTELNKILKGFSHLDIHFVEAKFVHELNGGIHCATNVAYACQP